MALTFLQPGAPLAPYIELARHRKDFPGWNAVVKNSTVIMKPIGSAGWRGN